MNNTHTLQYSPAAQHRKHTRGVRDTKSNVEHQIQDTRMDAFSKLKHKGGGRVTGIIIPTNFMLSSQQDEAAVNRLHQQAADPMQGGGRGLAHFNALKSLQETSVGTFYTNPIRPGPIEVRNRQ